MWVKSQNAVSLNSSQDIFIKVIGGASASKLAREGKKIVLTTTKSRFFCGDWKALKKNTILFNSTFKLKMESNLMVSECGALWRIGSTAVPQHTYANCEEISSESYGTSRAGIPNTHWWLWNPKLDSVDALEICQKLFVYETWMSFCFERRIWKLFELFGTFCQGCRKLQSIFEWNWTKRKNRKRCEVVKFKFCEG